MDHLGLLETLSLRQELSDEQAAQFMELMLSENVADAVKGASLALLRTRPATGRELALFAVFLRQRAAQVEVDSDRLLDTCGTGGGAPSFNISTSASVIAAAAGVPTAKHGNRAVTSTCGSADVLEACGVKVLSDTASSLQMLDAIGIAFLFAPAHHPAMKNVGKVRKELGVRTIFNQLGPLANPLGAKRQVMGVYSPDLTDPMADALRRLGAVHAAVVHSADGLDEVSPCAPTQVSWVKDGEVHPGQIDPPSFGLPYVSASAVLPGPTLEDNAAALRESLTDADGDRCRAVLPSAAAALYVAGAADSLAQAAELARETVKSGRAAAKLAEMAAYRSGVRG